MCMVPGNMESHTVRIIEALMLLCKSPEAILAAERGRAMVIALDMVARAMTTTKVDRYSVAQNRWG
jgi:hypothetical protein